MNSFETFEKNCNNLLFSINNGDVDTYKRLRALIVADIIDNDFDFSAHYGVREYEDSLTVGKALVVILDDMSHTGRTYKRIVLSALYSLLKVIIKDKNDNNPQTAIASALLLILFSENQDFVGGEYIVSKIRTVEAAAYQYVGMSSVFYWKYKFNVSKPTLLFRTQQRLQKAISSSTLDNPDIQTRNKVVDFEYDNFNSMLRGLPLDLALKYPGIPFYDPVTVLPKIKSMFKDELPYFKKLDSTSNVNESSNKEISKQEQNSGSKETGVTSGCLSIVMFFLVISLVLAFSI